MPNKQKKTPVHETPAGRPDDLRAARIRADLEALGVDWKENVDVDALFDQLYGDQIQRHEFRSVCGELRTAANG